ncbi:hypothetical protein KK083_16385 [Fulvivirgaceae bacterium PWU4]|uniref:BZIP transcription factor n=1 Tax=Chryseosolibacter histidini TaxID=2782349 RepID=A0AAP2GQ08_9BACT|nr:tail fiber protein [Chryseosolibacter histidini]MBT1698470.1 hypothetical protein [Chryseosolibacter histidini]
MKKNLLILFVLLTLKGYCQWNNSGNNTSTGNLTLGGSFISTTTYGVKLEPVSGDAVIKRNNAGNLCISSGSGDSQIRFNYNYGGGSGGIMVYDGGVEHHGDFWVTNGQLNIAASARHVMIGSSTFSHKLTLAGDLALGLSGAVSTISGTSSSGAIQIKNDASNGGAANRYLRLGWRDNNAVFYPVMAITEDYKVGIGTTTPSHKLTVAGDVAFGLDGAISTISGTSSSGAIQIKNDPSVGGASNRYLRLGWKDNAALFTPVLAINEDMNVGIGTTTPDTKLTVKGVIHTNEVRVDMESPIQGPDYVFEKDYDLLSLAELEAYIKANKHLPEVPSAKEMAEDGLNLKEMNLLLLKKVEELTLHLIEANKKIDDLRNGLKETNSRIKN